MSETDISAQVTAAVKRLRDAVTQRQLLSARVEAAKASISKAEAYRQIMNLMSAHVHCCLNQDYAMELERYWSRRDDIVYANGDLAYVGREAVWKYYAGSAGNRTIAAYQALGKEPPAGGEGKTPGYKNMNLIGTPYVEIAEDGKTAQGIWMAHSFQGCLDETGALVTQGVLSRYSGEFIFEDGAWKIWRRRNYADVVFEEEPAGMMGPPPTADGKPPKPMVVNPLPTTLTRIRAESADYTPDSLPAGGPALPQPYETWSYETSNVQKEGAF